MAERTTRFGFARFGPQIGGSLSDDGGKFTDADRVTLDAILAAFENHSHNDPAGGRKLENPENEPYVEFQPGAGSIPGGRTYHYAVTFVDQFGLETAPTPSGSVTLPAPLTTPLPPQVYAGDGDGTLEPGLYYYALTAKDEHGNETTASAPAAVTLLPGDRVARVALPDLPAAASAFWVWRQGPNQNGYTRVGSAGGNTDFLDNGAVPNEPCACDPGTQPPVVNLTQVSNGVLVQLQGETAARSEDPRVRSWRLYRTDQAGQWSGQSFIAEIVERDDQDRLVTEYVDTAAIPGFGVPPETNQCLASSVPFTFPIINGDPPENVPDGFVAVLRGELRVKYEDTWLGLGLGKVVREVERTDDGLVVHYTDQTSVLLTGIGGGGDGATQPGPGPTQPTPGTSVNAVKSLKLDQWGIEVSYTQDAQTDFLDWPTGMGGGGAGQVLTPPMDQDSGTVQTDGAWHFHGWESNDVSGMAGMRIRVYPDAAAAAADQGREYADGATPRSSRCLLDWRIEQEDVDNAVANPSGGYLMYTRAELIPPTAVYRIDGLTGFGGPIAYLAETPPPPPGVGGGGFDLN